MWGGKLVEPAGECRSNHEVICALAKRLGAQHRGFDMTPREIVDWTMRESGRGTLDELIANEFLDVQPDFRTAHYLDGFGYRDRKFRFKPDWPKVPNANAGPVGPWQDMPALPDQWDVLDNVDADHPFRLATSPARSFLNSTFTETPGSVKKEGGPTLMLHPEDAARLGVAPATRSSSATSAAASISRRCCSRVWCAASSSPNRSGPTPPTSMGAASTRSPERTARRLSEARPSTTTRSGSKKTFRIKRA